MHELSIAIRIVEIVQKAIGDDGGKGRVEKVRLNVGKLSAVVPESLRFCFEVAARGSRLEGAELVIDEIPAGARCRSCGHEWMTDDFVFSCPACGSGGIEVVSGRELGVESIEIRN